MRRALRGRSACPLKKSVPRLRPSDGRGQRRRRRRRRPEGQRQARSCDSALAGPRSVCGATAPGAYRPCLRAARHLAAGEAVAAAALERRAQRPAAALPPRAQALRDALEGRLQQLLDAVQLLVLVDRRVLGPPHVPVAGAPVALDAVHRHRVEAAGLPLVDAAGEPEVAFVELQPLVELQGVHEPPPPRRRAAGQRVADERGPRQAREAHHVLVDVLVGAVELRDEQVDEQDGGHGDKHQDACQQERVVRELPVVSLVQAHGDREETLDGLGHVVELHGLGLPQARQRAGEGEHHEQEGHGEAPHLRDDVLDHQHEGLQLGREDGHVYQQRPEDHHCDHGGEAVRRRPLVRLRAVLGGPDVPGA
mmetsp:Transcript_60311/g.162662  ORF Transcript_60311/g.162662 Transcript_60311/m.162662 type:complete len:365 (+) Transcript_60311:368-1462(+)